MKGTIYHRSFPIRFLNRSGSLAIKARWLDGLLDADRLIAKATANTGLDDFGPEDFLTPFRLLVHAYNVEAKLNFVGLLAARAHLLQLLENRLKMEQDRRRFPEIAQQQIEAPVFILGLPRTGSTLLFELMSRNPLLRPPLTWEVMLPSPPPRSEDFQTDGRIEKTSRMLAYFNHIAPEFQRIHEVGARLPQECLPMLAQSFRSLQFHTTHHVPSYQTWLNTADLIPAYAYHRRLLQHFQAFGPRGTWILKAPAHLFGINALFHVYPDARVIQTHRDPVKVIGSVCSHCATLRQAFSDHVDLETIGSTWRDLWATGLKHTTDFRQNHPALGDRFVDVYYEELVREPVWVMRQIHERLGLPLAPQAVAEAQSYLDSHPQGLHGTHSYTVDDFGLSAASVLRSIGEYKWRRPGSALPITTTTAAASPAVGLS